MGGGIRISFKPSNFSRQTAGRKSNTIYDNDQSSFNPATINPEMDNHLALNYGSYYKE
jgi:hypothetical protein